MIIQTLIIMFALATFIVREVSRCDWRPYLTARKRHGSKAVRIDSMKSMGGGSISVGFKFDEKAVLEELYREIPRGVEVEWFHIPSQRLLVAKWSYDTLERTS